MIDYAQIRHLINSTFVNQLRGLTHDCELRRETQSFDTTTSAVSFSSEVIAKFKATITAPKTEILRRIGDHLGQSGSDIGMYQAFIDPTTIYNPTTSVTESNKWLLSMLTVQSKLYTATSEYVIKEIQPIPNADVTVAIRLALYSE